MTTNGTPDVQLAVLREWRVHVDRRLDLIDRQLTATRTELQTGLAEMRDHVTAISRLAGRPLLSWPQALTLAVSLVGTVIALAAIVA